MVLMLMHLICGSSLHFMRLLPRPGLHVKHHLYMHCMHIHVSLYMIVYTPVFTLQCRCYVCRGAKILFVILMCVYIYRMEVCSLLLSHGADPTIPNCHSKTALDLTTSDQNRERLNSKKRVYHTCMYIHNSTIMFLSITYSMYNSVCTVSFVLL